MASKNEILDKITFSAFSLGGIYILYKNSKYISLPTLLIIIVSRYGGKIVKVSIEEDNAGGTTPYNPLKIPAKKITPIH